jgi:Fe2+ or Zn2+ uptake regulation protein
MTADATTGAARSDGRLPLDARPRPVAVDHADNHLVRELDRAGHRLTEPRRAVAELVAARDGHFTAAELVADTRRGRMDIGRATVFRTLDLFASLRLVERVDLPGGEHAYVACDPVHHHHAICTGCGRSLDVADHGLGAVLGEIGNRSGFRVTAHRLEIFGLCAACQGTAAAPS